jgi:hypothetical protein
MRAKLPKKALTFGDAVENVYDVYGQQRAKGFLRLAVKAQLIVFRGRNRCVLAGGKGRG